MYRFFWGYPISHNFGENLCTGFYLGYPISRNFRENICTGFFRDITNPKIFENLCTVFFWYIPHTKILEKIYVLFFYPIYQHLRRILCTAFFLGGGIPRIAYVSKILVSFFFVATSPYPPISQKN